MANISFPISLWFFVLLICPAVAFTSLTEEDFTFADNANHNIDKRGVLLPHADYRIREDVVSLQDEESYHTSPFYSRKLKEMKEVGLAPTPSLDLGFWEKVSIWLVLVIIILVRFALCVAVMFQTRDISFMRSKSIRPGEQLLPEPAAEDVAEPRLLADGDIVSQIVSTAFEDLSSAGRERALSHFLSEIDDAGILA
ncbi:hypothetical protein RHSIM_Rhsim05G0038700 [Rhododendron simsii]|uniref:Uncharacterized protein n=1 Tax=Rhododendron simsii TaxID=118357 RepID=A0A834GW49_RHOSS|nr:hypothetical protein RHSIM_Rhsim05G0038700 [Rhododendron simsii]